MLLGASCLEATQVTFDITTNVPCSRVASTSIAVGLQGQTEGLGPVAVATECRADGKVGAIGTYVVTPARREMNIEAAIKVSLALDQPTQCAGGGGPGCIVARRRINFVTHRSVRVPIELLLSCAGVSCNEGSTCGGRAATCVSSRVDITSCEDDGTCATLVVEPVDAGLPDLDAGVGDAGLFDAGVPDGGSADAGLSDGGARDAGAPDAGTQNFFVGGGFCSDAGWCQANPGPQSNDLFALWGASGADLWAAGFGGVLMHFDGMRWSSAAAAASGTFSALWGSGPNDVWAGGASGQVRHFDGSTWSVVSTGGSIATIRGAWGAAANDVWLVGDGSNVFHFNGSAWSNASLGGALPVLAVSGTSSTDVWAVTGGGELFHFNGTAWSAAASPTTMQLNAVWARTSTDVWAAGAAGTVLHFDGTTWSAVTNASVQPLRGIAGTAADAVVFVGNGGTVLRWNGSTSCRSASAVALISLQPGPTRRASSGPPAPSGRWRASPVHRWW